MKKLFIFLSVLCLCLTIPVSTYAGSHHTRISDIPDKDNGEGHRFNVGLSFAPTFDWMFPHTQGYERNGVTMGFRCGVPLNINLTKAKNYYVSTGLFFEQTGGKLKFINSLPITPNITFDSIGVQRRYRANYLTIPIGVTLKSKSIHNFYICGNVGFYSSFRLQSYNHDSYSINNEEWTREKRLSKEAAIFKESVYAGLGIEYSVTQDFRAGIYINYSHALNNYFKGKGHAQNSLTGLDQKANIGCLELVLNINFF